MAVTTQTQSHASRPVIGDRDASKSDKKALRRRSTADVEGNYERGSPSKAQPRTRKYTRSISSMSMGNGKEFDAEEFHDKRVMTPTQERFNALTMIPGMIYAVYFVVAGCWMLAGEQEGSDGIQPPSKWGDLARDAFGSEHGWMENFGCIDSPLFPYMTALPPLAVVAGAGANLVHSPFSMLYHWYATTVEPSKRIPHWSRRVDHASIHFASACAAYATSGRIDYCLLNVVFNLDCAYKQFEEKVQPRRNLLRLVVSILLYVLPVLVYGHYILFLQFALMFTVAFWLFTQYPVGGWSHSLFHMTLTFLPHLVMTAACRLESSQIQISLAAKCANIA